MFTFSDTCNMMGGRVRDEHDTGVRACQSVVIQIKWIDRSLHSIIHRDFFVCTMQ